MRADYGGKPGGCTLSLRVAVLIRGFTVRRNRKRLDEILEGNYLPKKGKLGEKDKERQSEQGFVKARKQHPAVEICDKRIES